MFTYNRREVFSHAPLALVAAEIRFTDAARLRQQPTFDAVTLAVEKRFPFAEQLLEASVNVDTIPLHLRQRSGVILENKQANGSNMSMRCWSYG